MACEENERYYSYAIYPHQSKSAKKVVKWGKGLVVFITKEARVIGWDDRTIVKVSVENEDGKKFIKLEKGMRL